MAQIANVVFNPSITYAISSGNDPLSPFGSNRKLPFLDLSSSPNFANILAFKFFYSQSYSPLQQSEFALNRADSAFSMKTDRFSILQWVIANQTITGTGIPANGITLFSIQQADTKKYLTFDSSASAISGSDNSTAYWQFFNPSASAGSSTSGYLWNFFYIQKIQNRIAYLSFFIESVLKTRTCLLPWMGISAPLLHWTLTEFMLHRLGRSHQ